MEVKLSNFLVVDWADGLQLGCAPDPERIQGPSWLTCLGNVHPAEPPNCKPEKQEGYQPCAYQGGRKFDGPGAEGVKGLCVHAMEQG